MRDYHLSVLGLDTSASEDDIKSAYRELSKRHHPDINKSPNAQEEFIRIKDAYEYLTKEPVYYEESFSFDDGINEQERWRMEYRQKAWEKEQENRRLQQELIRKIVRYFRPFAFAVLAMNALLVIDYILPLKDHEQRIEGMSRVYESSGGGRYGRGTPRYRYDEMYFEDFTMLFDRAEVIKLDHYDEAIVQATRILSTPMYAIITVNGTPFRHQQIYNIYFVFGYLIPVMIALCILFFRLKKPMHQLNASIFLLILSLIQLYLFFM